MSLFGSIRIANNSLQAQQIGLQVVGQNISNVNTPGYIREEVAFETAPGQRKGDLIIGLGVNVTGITQKIDQFLEDRVRTAASDAANSQVQQDAFLQLEGLIGELGDADLSTSLNAFFASIAEVLNQPESAAIRDLAVLQGQTLSDDFRRLEDRVTQIRDEYNDRVITAGNDINRLTEEIFSLNRRISLLEAGEISRSDAVGLRDQRNIALSELSDLIDIRVDEQKSGIVTVAVGGDTLISEVSRRIVEVKNVVNQGQQVASIEFVDTESQPEYRSGRLVGLIEARDDVLGGFLEDLDTLAGTLAFEFNRLHASGQGLTGYQSLVGEFAVTNAAEPLDAAGLTFTPENGSFQVLVRDRSTNVTQTTDILVDLNGLDEDSSLDDIVAALDAIDGISASVTSDLTVSIQSDSSDIDFSFANDTSGLLSALGLNTFFSGSTAGSLGVRDELRSDSRLLAASQGGIAEDTNNAVLLAGFIESPLDTANGESIDTLYKRLTGNTTQGASVARAVADGDQVFFNSLEAQRFAVSGVNLDDEIVRMISYQRAYQAAARYISELNELMDILVNL